MTLTALIWMGGSPRKHQWHWLFLPYSFHSLVLVTVVLVLWQGVLMLIVIHWHHLSVSLQLPICTAYHFLHKSLKPHFLPEWLGNLGLCGWTVGMSSHAWLWNDPSTAAMFLQCFSLRFTKQMCWAVWGCEHRELKNSFLILNSVKSDWEHHSEQTTT